MLYNQEIEELDNKLCGLCNQKIDLKINTDGLVINDQHFICSRCCVKADKERLMRFVKDKSVGSTNIRPMIRWAWERYNK